MNAAYKLEKKKKKKAKRRMQSASPASLKVTEPLFAAGDSPSAKKVKDSLYLSFPVETVLATEPNGAEGVKTELAYRLAQPDVH